MIAQTMWFHPRTRLSVFRLCENTFKGPKLPNLQRNHQKFVPVITILEKAPPMGISSQNTLLNNFSPVQPILINNTLIDSARISKTQGDIENFPNFV
jgi:hypothetical protein